MGLLSSSDSHYRRLPRSARSLARGLLRRGSAYHRAHAVRAAGNALGYAVEVAHNPGARRPSEPGDPIGQRVRLGSDTRDLLKRLLASRNRLHQVALVREIRHQISKRIALHQRRSRRLQAARSRGAQLVKDGWRLRDGRTRTAPGRGRARTAAAAPVPTVSGTPPVADSLAARRRAPRRRLIAARPR